MELLQRSAGNDKEVAEGGIDLTMALLYVLAFASIFGAGFMAGVLYVFWLERCKEREGQ